MKHSPLRKILKPTKRSPSPCPPKNPNRKDHHLTNKLPPKVYKKGVGNMLNCPKTMVSV